MPLTLACCFEEEGILAARADIPRGFWMILEDFGLEALICYGMGRQTTMENAD